MNDQANNSTALARAHAENSRLRIANNELRRQLAAAEQFNTIGAATLDNLVEMLSGLMGISQQELMERLHMQSKGD